MNNSEQSAAERRILVVEDEEGPALSLVYQLTRIGCVALGPLATGEQAVEQAGEQAPNLVIMDISLAGAMDGIEAARQIRERFGIPVIFLSAYTEEQVIRQARDSGPYGYLVKPVKEGDLRAAVEIALYKHAMEARLSESELRYRLLFEKSSDGFCLGEIIVNEQGHPVDFRFLAINPAFEKISDVPAQRLVGCLFREVFPDVENSRVIIERLGRAALGGETVQFEMELKESSRTVSIHAYSFKPGQFAATAEDITMRVRAEEQLRESYHHLARSYRRLTILRTIDQATTLHTDLASMSHAILSDVITHGEIDGAALFVPNLTPTGSLRSSGPLGLLQLQGLSGMTESAVDSSVLNWQTTTAIQAYQTKQPVIIADLRREDHPGALTLHRAAGFHTCAAVPLNARGPKGVMLFFFRQQLPLYSVSHPATGERRSPALHLHTAALQEAAFRRAEIDDDWLTYLQSLALQVAIAIDHVEMLDNLKRSNHSLASAYDETIKGWAQALELRDQETRGHSTRVSELTVKLATRLGIQGDALDHIRRGAFLHDVGKMAIPDRILRNTGPLSPEEWVTMRQHTTIAYKMLYNIDYLRPALDVVYSHHEKWDGSGYPRGLKGEDIPLSARIFAVVDVWDALTNERPYRLAWPAQEARAYIIEQSGKHFDPRVVEVFLNMFP